MDSCMILTYPNIKAILDRVSNRFVTAILMRVVKHYGKPIADLIFAQLTKVGGQKPQAN